MSPGEVAHVVRLRLRAEIEKDLGSLNLLVDSIRKLSSEQGGEQAWVVALALAYELDRIYTAVESVLCRALRTLDGDVPAGPSSHLETLHAAAVALEGGRPALIDSDTESDLRVLLGFRHLARHGYEQEPVPKRVHELADLAMRTHPRLVASLGQVMGWLKA